MITLDIETIPRIKYLDPENPYYPQPKLEDAESYKKEDTRQKWRDINEQIKKDWHESEPMIKQLSVNPRMCDPIAIGLCEGIYYGIGDPSINTLSEFIKYFSDITEWIELNLPLTTFNGKMFDIPVLIHSLILAGEKDKADYLMKFLTPPYQHYPHLDLMTLFPGKTSLEDWCYHAEITTAKHGQGSQIYGWWKAGEMNKIHEHLTNDLKMTYELAQKYYWEQ